MVVKGVWGGWGESVKKGEIRDENFFCFVLNENLKVVKIVSVDVKADWKQQEIKNW